MSFLFSRRPSAPGLLAALCLLAVPPRALQSASTVATSTLGSPKIGSRASQLALAALVAAIAQSPLQAVEPTLASAVAKDQLVKAALLTRKAPVEVLMIGDSMTVGGFGDSVQKYLYTRYGSNRVALYASCGSSPESWLKGEPDYITKCGYKAQTPVKKYYTDFTDGHKPNPTVTPKIEDLLAYHQPKTVIVQLGTNWMDALDARGFAVEGPKCTAILTRFAGALSAAKSVKKVIWITPPDSSKYTSETERNVATLICTAARLHGYTIVNSANMTHYIAGKTGGDGVHYRNEDAYAWAASVEGELRRKMR